MPQASLETPVGRLVVTEKDGAIVAISWRGEAAADRTPLLDEAARQLAAYFEGRLTGFDLPIAPAGSAFHRRAWQAMREIPYGATRSYSELAHLLDAGPRAVGGACAANPIPIVTPCHRILAARGAIGGFSGGAGLPTKRALLALEQRHSGAAREAGAPLLDFARGGAAAE